MKMTNTNTQNSARSQRKARNNIAPLFAAWINSKGIRVINFWRKARDPKVEARAARADVRAVRADAFARDLLRPLVELTVDLACELQKQAKKRLRFEIFERYARKIDPILKGIVEQYPTQPTLSDFSDFTGIPMFLYRPIPSGRDYAKALAVSSRLEEFLWLASEGVFADFRRCALPTCASYFYPLRPERLYCSPGCQRTHYKQSPEYKKKNREYQRAYYRAHFSSEAKRNGKSRHFAG
jgi:hypothetical protein